MIIKVTQEHIDKGQANNCYHCPVALAIKDAMPLLDVVSVGSRDITVKYGSREGSYLTPPRARGFIADFDRLSQVSPFEFSLTEKEFSPLAWNHNPDDIISDYPRIEAMK